MVWDAIDKPDFRSSGVDYVNNSGWSGSASAGIYPPAVPPIESDGGDWWFDLTTVRDANNNPDGSIAVGYVGWTNWGYVNGCWNASVGGGSLPPTHFGNDDLNRGNIRQAIGRYDENGSKQWIKGFMGGLFYSVIQDSDGNIVAVGVGSGADPNYFTDISGAPPLYFNPTSGVTPQPFPSPQPCPTTKGQFHVVKIDVNGNILWNHYYSAETDPLLAMEKEGVAYGIVETERNNVRGYRVVGRVDHGSVGNTGKPYMIQLDLNGMKEWDVLLPNSVAQNTAPMTWQSATTFDAWFSAISRTVDPNSGDEVFAVSGSSDGSGQSMQAFLSYYSEPTSGTGYVLPVWITDMQTSGSNYPGHLANMRSITTDVEVWNDGTTVRLAWPVVDNITGPWYSGGHYAYGHIYLFDPTGATPQLLANMSLGELHAFDLQIGITRLTDGDLALVASKWPPGYGIDVNNIYNWDDFTSGIQNCLTGYNSTSNYWGQNNPAFQGPTIPFGGPAYRYYGSQSYATKLSATTLNTIWETQWDHGYQPSDDCFPGNVRHRQCNFRVVEAADGGLLVCGNTGHNFDDTYLVKLAPCEPNADYSAFHALYPFDPSNEYHITTNATWSSDLSVRGSVIVDDGVTLTIDGATIGFADSRQIGYPTNLIVSLGATLIAENGAVLTSLEGCSGSMWDGVRVLGNGTSIGAGVVQVITGSEISNALVGIMAGDGDPEQPVPFLAQGGGLLLLNDAVFSNNQYDVFRTNYTDLTPQVYTDCVFRTTGVLNHSWRTPIVHAYMYGTGSTGFHGCTFSNYTTPLPPDPLEWAIGGVMAINATLVLEPLTTNAPQNMFSNLYFGVRHASFDPSRTLVMDRNNFSNCSRATWIIGTDNLTFTRNTVDVGETVLDSYDYGTYIYNCTGFEYEDNIFSGDGTTTAKVGSIFSTCGPASNEFYRNDYDGFTGFGPDGYSAGAIISGSNQDPGQTFIGLQFKCNNFSSNQGNDHDIAFTDVNVSVSSQQGVLGTSQSLAGNTFAFGTDCMIEPNKHMYVEDGNVSIFTYWHHAIDQNIELVPNCADAPIDPQSWYFEASTTTYNPDPIVGSCPLLLNPVAPPVSTEAGVVYAANQLLVLEAVYDDWSDGGDPEGLIDFIHDPSNDSYAVRNQLMLLAPKVSEDAWTQVFERQPPMEPWHLAQALMANSPLPAEVYNYIDNSGLSPYYIQLVENAQNGGVSMHSIYRSELAHFAGMHTRGLRDITSRALQSGNSTDLTAARVLHETYPVRSSAQNVVGLSLALGDHSRARQIIDQELINNPGSDFWVVQDMYVGLLENNLGPEDASPAQIASLTAIANSMEDGSGAAQAWLVSLGLPVPEHVVLPWPDHNHRPTTAAIAPATPQFLNVMPNPSSGPVMVGVQLPEGAETANLTIRDPLGRVLDQYRVQGSVALIEIGSHVHSSGIYFAELRVDGLLLTTAKFEVVP